MVKLNIVDHLMEFGLTRQEATIYECLLKEGKLTGYEVAKCTGISRSNAYGALAALAEKGAAYVSEEGAKKYTPVSVKEFCENQIHHLQEEQVWIETHLPKKKESSEGYITVEGQKNILNKIHNLLAGTKERVYISCDCEYLADMKEEIDLLVEQNKKVVILTDQSLDYPGTIVYPTEQKGCQIGIIIDSQYVLSGEYGAGSDNNCLYSGQKNIVEVLKKAMSNEIKLIGYTRGEQ